MFKKRETDLKGWGRRRQRKEKRSMASGKQIDGDRTRKPGSGTEPESKVSRGEKRPESPVALNLKGIAAISSSKRDERAASTGKKGSLLIWETVRL